MITFNDISVEKYKNIQSLSNIETILAIILDKTDSELEKLDLDQYNLLLNDVKNIKKNTKFVRSNFLEIGDIKLYYKDFKDLTLGEYIDIINYVKDNNINNIMSIFWRVKTKEEDLLNNYILEDYTFDIEHRSKIFDDVSIIYYFQIKLDLENYMKIIDDRYKIIFDEELLETDKELSKKEKLEREHLNKIKETYNRNAWNYTVYNLAEGDITKYNQIFRTNVFTVLNTLKIRKELELTSKSK